MTDPRFKNAREVKSPTGPELTCKSWLTEAPFRMLQNNLDREVAENPDEGAAQWITGTGSVRGRDPGRVPVETDGCCRVWSSSGWPW